MAETANAQLTWLKLLEAQLDGLYLPAPVAGRRNQEAKLQNACACLSLSLSALACVHACQQTPLAEQAMCKDDMRLYGSLQLK